ncbi:MAG: hypothetical protein JRI23_16385 [Deltaproteobacteria bacterium]|nr:hypothetical protein [Deltaproteobacteria bacterium]MBW2533353.1 hypothetical protein [Deltaproteobacteria bacterium]
MPKAWYRDGFARLEAKQPVRASALLADLDTLEAVMRGAYGGWDSAAARGWDWDEWFDRWRSQLSERQDQEVPLEEAFSPLEELIGFQLDNHTNIPLGLRFGSGSRSATLSKAPAGPCDRARMIGGGELPLRTDDPSEQPRKAQHFGNGRFKSLHYLAYPALRGALAAVRCQGEWIDAQPVWVGAAPTRALAKTEEDRPAYRRLGSHAVLVRLPTFSKENGERLRQDLPQWPPRGAERVLVLDLRDNEGGDAAFAALLRWLDVERVKASLWSQKTLATSCSYHALRWGYTMLSSFNIEPPISDGLRAMLQGSLDALAVPQASCDRSFATTPEQAKVLPRRFEPNAKRPTLRVVALVNQGCGSDCEFMVRVLATMPETLIVGTNTYGVGQFIQPGFSLLPRTRLPYRIALGTADQYGDGRSFDGYGFDVDILLTDEADHSPEAIEPLVARLAGAR